MQKWSSEIEEELSVIIKDWLKQQGKTQKDLKKELNAPSERIHSLLETLNREYSSGGLPKLVAKLCLIEDIWSKDPCKEKTNNDLSDPLGQLDLLLEEINEDCNT